MLFSVYLLLLVWCWFGNIMVTPPPSPFYNKYYRINTNCYNLWCFPKLTNLILPVMPCSACPDLHCPDITSPALYCRVLVWPDFTCSVLPCPDLTCTTLPWLTHRAELTHRPILPGQPKVNYSYHCPIWTVWCSWDCTSDCWIPCMPCTIRTHSPLVSQSLVTAMHRCSWLFVAHHLHQAC